MLCPHCQAENASAFGYCTSCGKPLSQVHEALQPPPPIGVPGAAAAAAPALAPSPKKMSVPAMLGVVAVAAIIVLVGALQPVNEPTEAGRAGYRIGWILAALVIPWLIAYVIAGRKTARNPNKFAAVFCIVGPIMLVFNVLSSGMLTTGLESPEAHVGRLMREASGVQPVRNAFLPSQRRLDDAMREQFRKLVQANKDYTEQVKNADMSDVQRINSPESFADPEYAATGLRQLHSLYDVDAAQEQKVKEIMDNLRHILETETPVSEREATLKSFDAVVAAQSATRQKAVAAEKAWIEAVDEEYAYAARNSSQIHWRESRLTIDDNDVREQLNARLREQEAQRKSFLETQEQFRKFQEQQLQKMGVAPKDVGR